GPGGGVCREGRDSESVPGSDRSKVPLLQLRRCDADSIKGFYHFLPDRIFPPYDTLRPDSCRRQVGPVWGRPAQAVLRIGQPTPLVLDNQPVRTSSLDRQHCRGGRRSLVAAYGGKRNCPL